MLGDYSEFENICKVLVCNELVKSNYGICLIVFQHVLHSSYARHLTKMPSRCLGGILHLKICHKPVGWFYLDYPGCFAFLSMKTAKNVDARLQKQVTSMKRAVFVDGLTSDLLLQSWHSAGWAALRRSCVACFEQLLMYLRIDYDVNYRRY